MDITPVIAADKKVITRYGDGSFIVSGEKITGSIFITPSKVEASFFKDFNEFTAENLAFLSDYSLELILLGIGEKHLAMPKQLKKSLIEMGIRFEHMSSGAACRTYNILLAEGREIGALILAV